MWMMHNCIHAIQGFQDLQRQEKSLFIKCKNVSKNNIPGVNNFIIFNMTDRNSTFENEIKYKFVSRLGKD